MELSQTLALFWELSRGSAGEKRAGLRAAQAFFRFFET